METTTPTTAMGGASEEKQQDKRGQELLHELFHEHEEVLMAFTEVTYRTIVQQDSSELQDMHQKDLQKVCHELKVKHQEDIIAMYREMQAKLDVEGLKKMCHELKVQHQEELELTKARNERSRPICAGCALHCVIHAKCSVCWNANRTRVAYCSSECHITHWAQHKRVCGMGSAGRAKGC